MEMCSRVRRLTLMASMAYSTWNNLNSGCKAKAERRY